MKPTFARLASSAALDAQVRAWAAERPGAPIAVFAPMEFDLPARAAAWRELPAPVWGGSSCGVIYAENETDDPVRDHAAVAVQFRAPGAPPVCGFWTRRDGDSRALGERIGQWAAARAARPALLLLTSGLDTNGDELLAGIERGAGAPLPVFGAMAGDDAQFRQTLVFTNGQCAATGATALVWDREQCEWAGMTASGWTGIGVSKCVTRADGNRVYEIDGEPALDVYLKYLSITESDLPHMGIEYPLQVTGPDARPTLRAVIDLDREARALIFTGTVPTGAQVRFATAPGFETVDHTGAAIAAFAAGAPRADLLLLFVCIARRLALGPMVADEIRAAARQWKQPVAGFFAYGEFGCADVRPEFSNEMYALALCRFAGGGTP